MSFPLFLAAKYLKPNRSPSAVVTFIAILGVVLGVAILIIVRAVMTGFGDMWREKILAFKPHITINSIDGVIHNEDELVAQIKDIPGITGVSPSIEVRGLAEHNGYVQAPVLIGISPDGAESLHPALADNIIDGKLSLDGNNAIIGSDLAHLLNVKAGDKVLIYSPANFISEEEMYFPEEIVISGIYQMGQGEFDGGYIITSIPFMRDLLGLIRGGAYSIHIKTSDPQTPQVFSRVTEEINAILPHNHYLRTWHEVDRELFAAIAVEKNMMVILLMFITIVAIFCVANTIIVITVRKTAEIGLLKALGFSSREVTMAFVLYGWIQCFIGTIIGVGLAFLVLCNLHGIVDFIALFGVDVFPKSVYGLDRIPWRIIPSEIVQTVIFVIGACALASILPAWRAAVKKPVEALRS